MTITTVTLNAAIDKTYFLPRFPLGKVTRVGQLSADAGGKGINAARVASLLGADVTATGFAGGFNGRYIESELEKQGIARDFVHLDDESRVCLNIIDEAEGTSTELLEPGPTISPQQMAAFKEKLAQLAARSRVVIFSGSLPAGVEKDAYAELISIAKRQGAITLLDTSGDALRLGIEAAPFMIKPNEDEAAQLTGEPADPDRLPQQLERFARQGIGCVIVSLGADGAVALWGGRAYRVRVPLVQAVNTVGCGDAFTAGLAVALTRGLPPEECLRLAAAAGAANALQRRTGYVDAADVTRLAGEVRVEHFA
ncbi:1-phosphofructokinase [Paenibacillus hamazuiensis]|uniref:1-phosphofructokinase n=1 Tax=Paenibacillus hamazuiensis TaxID=2936508 RepID=UPI00200D0F70|nr:1-phosphofructokinase [Paenibacillus hamazuiensis]